LIPVHVRLDDPTSLEQPSHTGTVNVSLDEDVDTTNAVKLDLLVLVLAPVTHANQVCAASVVLLVAFGQDGVGVQSLAQTACLVGFDPRVVVD
jgi:hypothetical protein